MKTILIIAILIGLTVSCNPPKAPAVKRVPNYEQIDKRYLKDVFVPNYTGSKQQLSQSITQLKEHWAEFQGFMLQVEAGKIPVTEGFKGDWQSSQSQDGARISALYSNRLGLVVDFQKHNDRHPFPLIYGFVFSANGRLIQADTMEDRFKFDEHGRVVEYWHK